MMFVVCSQVMERRNAGLEHSNINGSRNLLALLETAAQLYHKWICSKPSCTPVVGVICSNYWKSNYRSLEWEPVVEVCVPPDPMAREKCRLLGPVTPRLEPSHSQPMAMHGSLCLSKLGSMSCLRIAIELYLPFAWYLS